MENKGKLFVLKLLLLVFMHYLGFAAPSDDTLYCRSCNITNDSINYDIVLRSCVKCVPIKTEGYYVMMDLTQEQCDTLLNYPKNKWITILKDERTDFAANIVLHYLYDKEAILLTINDNPKHWRRASKSAYIAYWRKFLSKH